MNREDGQKKCFGMSFDNIHRNSKKCTPKQIMMYPISLKLHKLLNEVDNTLTFEQVTVMDQLICTVFSLLVKGTKQLGGLSN